MDRTTIEACAQICDEYMREQAGLESSCVVSGYPRHSYRSHAAAARHLAYRIRLLLIVAEDDGADTNTDDDANTDAMLANAGALT